MGKKKKRNPDQEGTEPDKIEETSEGFLDETLYVRSESEPDTTDPAEIDMTVVAETVLENTILEDSGSASDQDPNATVGLESTVEFDKSSERSRVEPGAKTVDSGQLDQTVALPDATGSKHGAPTVRMGKTASSKTVVRRGQSALVDSQNKTVDLCNTTIDPSSERSGGQDFSRSVLASPEIGATVNPRELSREDAAAWSQAVGNHPSEASILPPAIERTFTDLQFERLRTCDIAHVKSDPHESSDYRLIRKLGQGGMGDVFVARQGSLDRLLALKVIKPLEKKRVDQLVKVGKLEAIQEERRLQFLAEAIITGDLDHPNIVPIHDVAVTKDGELFYSMKRVVGTPWSEVIAEKSRDENVEILLKIADAIAFAHTRGVVHRDIKPENVMLGDFGVVMVMDWGLALPTSQYPKHKQESILSTTGLGGTPAFMAPEMATGPLTHIGPPADIYLLGATLFMIVTGKAPHYAKNITDCLKAVRSNRIREVPDEQRGELLDIALRAMATAPADRYDDVESFQAAIRQYRAHSESISLATRAQEDLERGRRDHSYPDFARATFGFEQAIDSWDGNQRAHAGLADTTLAHAQAAHHNGDYDLGLSLLDADDPEHAPIIADLHESLHERESRIGRLAMMRKLAVAMLAFILIGGNVALYFINAKRNEALAAHSAAENALEGERSAKEQATRSAAEANQSAIAAKEAEQEALTAAEEERKAKFVAEQATKDAIASAEAARKAEMKEKESKQVAIQEKKKAEQAALDEQAARLAADKAADAARVAKEQAEYEEYVSKIGLAKARLERNEAQGAREILRQLKNSPRADSWEWKWLWKQANQSQSDSTADAPIIDLSISKGSLRGILALSNGTVERLSFAADGRIETRQPVKDPMLGRYRATSVAVSSHGETIAVGTESGAILLIETKGVTRLGDSRGEGHQRAVSDLQFTRDRLLVSGSLDRTVRVWDVSTGQELTRRNACWHLSPVRQLAVSGDKRNLMVAVATADAAVGQVALWRLKGNSGFKKQRLGSFDQHTSKLTAISLSEDGQLAASGDAKGNVLLWNPASLEKTDYTSAIKGAVAKISKEEESVRPIPAKRSEIRIGRLVDSRSNGKLKLVSTFKTEDAPLVAHTDIVRSIRFNRDGKSILTSSDDYTLKLWDASSRKLKTTFRGHGGWVIAGEFLDTSDSIVSASNDSSVRTWKPGQYLGAFVSQNVVAKEKQADTSARNQQAHDDEISSARFSPDGNRIVTASRDHTARILEIDKQSLAFREIARINDEVLSEGTSFVAMSMVVDQAKRRLFIGSADATIRVWDLQRGVEIARLPRTGINLSFSVDPSGEFLLSGSSSPKTKAILWQLDPNSVRKPRIVHRLVGHDQSVTAYAISPDAKRLFTGDRDGYGILWDATSGQRIGEPLEQVRGFRINQAAFSKDGRELFLASDDEQLTRVDLASREVIGRLDHNGFVTGFSLARDEQAVVTLSELTTERRLTTTATLWDLDTGASQRIDRTTQDLRGAGGKLNRSRDRITSVKFDRDGDSLVVCRSESSGRGAIVKVWDQSSLRRAMRQPVLTRQIDSDAHGESTVSNHDFKPIQTVELPKQLSNSQLVMPLDRRDLITMNRNGAFRWDLTNGKLVRSYRSHAELTEARFSFDGSYVATASRSLKLWEADTGKALSKIEAPHVGPVRALAFAPIALGATKYVLATGGDDGVVRIWKWNAKDFTFTSLREYEIGAGITVNQVRFSRDAKRLLAVGSDGSARVWFLDGKTAAIKIDEPDAGDFLSGAFSDDGKTIGVGSSDASIRVWEIPGSGKQLTSPIMLNGHADAVLDIVMQGKMGPQLRVFSASADDSARVWDPRIGVAFVEGEVSLGREIITLREHNADVSAVDFSEADSLLMTAGNDGKVILWPAN